ncbi:hypothetical protein CKA32_000945 [Geitlerinema sp. FC II]|nr:hypothetical protein CKA32_000945 [Geitlerinema sp. FC II]
MKMQEYRIFKVWSGRREVKVRRVTYSDLETGTEFRWVTNLPEPEELSYSNKEIV